MKFLNRKARQTETVRPEERRTVTREIEITVERKWVTLTARPQSEETQAADAAPDPHALPE